MFDRTKQKLFGSVGLVVSDKELVKRARISTDFKFDNLDKISKPINVTCNDVNCNLYGCRTFINDILTYHVTYEKMYCVKICGKYFHIIKLIEFEEIELDDDTCQYVDQFDEELAQLTNDEKPKQFFEEIGSRDCM